MRRRFGCGTRRCRCSPFRALPGSTPSPAPYACGGGTDMKRTFGSRRGNSMVEFTLVGIPLIFALISIFELARGMWIYHTMAYAIKDTTRYVAVHGQLCRNVNIGCAVTMDNISRHL